MKNKLIALGAVLFASFAITTAQTAKASGGGKYLLFNTTNVLASVTAVTSYPTNGFTTNISFGVTNTVGALTGGPVAIGQYDNLVLVASGLGVGTNTGATNVIGIGYVTANCVNTPQLTLGTNVWSAGSTIITYSDWSSTTNWIVWTVPIAGTNWFNLQTNFNSSSLPGASTYIGIVAITNAGFVNGFVTNFSVGIEDKSIPRPIYY